MNELESECLKSATYIGEHLLHGHQSRLPSSFTALRLAGAKGSDDREPRRMWWQVNKEGRLWAMKASPSVWGSIVSSGPLSMDWKELLKKSNPVLTWRSHRDKAAEAPAGSGFVIRSFTAVWLSIWVGFHTQQDHVRWNIRSCPVCQSQASMFYI